MIKNQPTAYRPGMNVIRGQPFDRAANASNSPRPQRFPNFLMNGAPWLCSVGLPTKLAYSVHQTGLFLCLAYLKNVPHVRQHFENNQVIIIITDLLSPGDERVAMIEVKNTCAVYFIRRSCCPIYCTPPDVKKTNIRISNLIFE
jgi:hypothetical protein